MLPLLMKAEQGGGPPFNFQYDPLQDVMESCAYHFWGLFTNPIGELGILIMGGGVPKNFALQPEPSLLQNFMLDSGKYEVRGYKYDLQITSAPVTDGSLSSCPARRGGLVGAKSTARLSAKPRPAFTAITPQLFWPLAYALFERRREFTRQYDELSDKKKAKMLKENAEARGLLRVDGAPRLFLQRRQLLADFVKVAGSKKNLKRIQNWFEGKPELLEALDKLRAAGALDVGEI